MPEIARSWMKWLGFLLFFLALLFAWHHWSMARGLLPLAVAQYLPSSILNLWLGLKS